MRSRNKLALTQEQIDKINNIYSTSEEKRVFLTFDDGPSKTVTPLILDLLKQEDIKATFFVLGNRVEQNPEILKRIFEEGHYIANHGYSHKYSNIYTSIQSVLDEYNKTEQCIKTALKNEEYNSRVFRFPRTVQ
ncbi:MAG: polysaccharide deacetylase family protein, partial [Clostridia bacterium]|nr:polysaccharide deacetylase family protein [Clostridia bacterium]